ncbi:ABC transporter permease [Kordiimonas marina]|uniref:ABC transporter permease n=1 Tax=Kordiimonas marina TaxID=2872312 RepID=UPI001FF2C69A|nr:ABC transporter permease [Kordiimonas marina]MCJ9427712.1 ABC transporter permease [Kordiimonas marina]
MKLLSQIWVVIVMNIRSLPQRLWMSLAAILAVTVVVAVLLSFLSMANGFAKTLEGTGSNDIAIVTRGGSQSELNSVLSRHAVNAVSVAPGVAKTADGQPYYSAELYVVVNAIKKSSGTKVNIPLRGIDPIGFTLRDHVKITAGRMFQPGKNEIIVGQKVLGQFSGFELGKEVKFGKSRWTVVGIFSTGGTAFESELWADARTVQSQFRRGDSYQTMRIKLTTPGDLSGIEKAIKADPTLNLDVKTEAQYFAEQGQALKNIVRVGWAISIVMSLGALAGALNTMFTSVASRSKEIATLRAIGFSNVSAFFGTLAESVVLSVLGGLVGALMSYLFMDGMTTSTLGASFTQVIFTFELSPALFEKGIILALLIGVIGGFFPAWRAARLPVVVAFRNAS